MGAADDSVVIAQRGPRRLARIARRVLLGVLMSCCCAGLAVGKDKTSDDDDEAAKPASALPNIYLDLRTNVTTVPADTLSIGLGNSSLSGAITTLQSLSRRIDRPGGALPLSSPSSQGVSLDVPLTVDVTDRMSFYGGVTGSASQSGSADWSAFTLSSWNVGVQAELYQQNGGAFPSVTLQSTLTRSVPDQPLATTSLNTVVEFNYALNEDETKGLLAGAQYTAVEVDSPLARVNPTVVGFVGGYYQWDNNWKVTGRAGIQSFGGAQLLNLTPFQPFTQPLVRFDLDRMDDNDNRLFGVTAQVAWTPKPAFQLTVRTPLYAVRN
jgi:hypothetical protein